MAVDTSAVLRLVAQRHQADCGIAALATLCGVSYEEALLAVGDRKVINSGVMLKQIRDAGRRLKTPLTLKLRFDPKDSVGIIGFNSHTWKTGHVAILRYGVVYDLQDLTVWDLDDYLSNHQATVASLLIIREK